MFKQIFKNSIRHLSRNRLFTFLNILGLSIGISSCWVIYRYVSYELSFERGLPNKEHTYRIISKIRFNDGEEQWNGGISRPIYYALREDVQGADRVVPVYKFYAQSVIIPSDGYANKRIEELDFEKNNLIETDATYFEMLPYKWLGGDKHHALKTPNQVILTEDRAKFYFPNLRYEEIVGKTLIYADTLQKTVSGIVANLSYPSEFNGQEFFLLQKRERDNLLTEWTNTSGTDMVYIQTKNREAADRVLRQISNIVAGKYKQYDAEVKPQYKYERNLQLLPVQESHFSTFLKERVMNKTSKNVVFGLIAVGIFLLVLACINYINLTTAQIPQRHKEIGIRKTLGSSHKSLILQMMMETLIVVSIALFCSAFLSQIGIRLLGDMMSEEAKTFGNPITFALFLLTILGITTMLAGFYPSWLITRVNALDIFRTRGYLQVGKKKLNIRKLLIVFQFVIAQVFIVGALIVGQQLRYVVQKDMGFNKDAVIISDIPFKLFGSANYNDKKVTLAHEVRNIPGIREITMGEAPLSSSYRSTNYLYSDGTKADPVSLQVFKKHVDNSYLEFYDLELVAGSNLAPSDTTNAFVINESALRAFGFKRPEDAIGKIIGQRGLEEFPIVGVVRDFHQRDFFTPIEPLVLMNGRETMDTYNIRLDVSQRNKWPEIIRNIHKTWAQFFPEDTFSYNFYDESIASMYKKEQQLQKLTNISTAMAIIISCLGLFGLATITAFQRSKEIGIRKVLGASVSGIVAMLSVDFVKVVIIAIVIASPMVWLATHKWLEDFVYRIEITSIPFVLGGFTVILAALLTVSYQAIRAAGTNPVDSLRDE